MLEILKQDWPWYITGPLIGLMVPLLLVLSNKHFGISSSFKHLCAMVPNKIKYFQYDWKLFSWNLLLVSGVIAGGFFAHNFLDTNDNIALSQSAIETLEKYKLSQIENELIPSELFNWNNPIGLILLSLGGLLIGFGTRYGDGCTSGHAIMGLSLLNLGSLIAVIGFFIGGLLVTHLILPIVL